MGFDGPGKSGPVVFGEQDVGAEGVEVFGVEEQAVHVEETGADGSWWSHCVMSEGVDAKCCCGGVAVELLFVL